MVHTAMYINQETIVKKKFYKLFKQKCDTFEKIITVLEETICETQYKTDEYDKYVIILLSALNLKCLVSIYDRLNKGYWSDSEALIKKSIENFLAQVFFYNNVDKAKEYCFNNTKLNKIIGNRNNLSKKLDELNKKQKLFPTDMENFFQNFIYEAVYRQANRMAHMDFDVVHKEISANIVDTKLSSDLIIGPKFDKETMETTLTRLLFISMFSLSFIAHVNGKLNSQKHERMFKEFINFVNSLPQTPSAPHPHND